MLSANAMARVPPVSQLAVTSVQSAAGGADYVEGSGAVSRHHGGSYVHVRTFEAGMGNARATMNGANLAEIGTKNACFQGTWRPCRNGETIQGHYRIWDATGKGNGTFTVSSQSTSTPRNTVSRSISIW
jgi:hypothetical protein